MEYDIFISYRREDGTDVARAIKAELVRRGYRVFLDFDELKDSVFDDRIIHAINSSPIFLSILSERYLDRCLNEDDWVRKEIECATNCGSHIIPVNLNCSFKMPSSLPDSIIGHFSRHQFSDLMMSSLFESSMDKMITERIAPIVGKGILHRNSRRKWCIALSVVLVVVICLSGYFFFKRSNAKAQADICSELVERASALTQIPDSLFSAQKCISEAESIVASYSNSLFRDMFPSEVEKVSYRVKYVRDSIFDKYQSLSDEYFDRFMENATQDDLNKSLHYARKALEIKNESRLEKRVARFE